MTAIKTRGGKRPDAGRKPLPDEQKKKQRSITLTDGEYTALVEMADKEKISASALVARWIEKNNNK